MSQCSFLLQIPVYKKTKSSSFVQKCASTRISRDGRKDRPRADGYKQPVCLKPWLLEISLPETGREESTIRYYWIQNSSCEVLAEGT